MVDAAGISVAVIAIEGNTPEVPVEPLLNLNLVDPKIVFTFATVPKNESTVKFAKFDPVYGYAADIPETVEVSIDK